MQFNPIQQKQLLDLARNVILSHFDHHKVHKPEDPAFQEKKGVFVSLHLHGKLRGCIGYVKGVSSIVDSVVEMAHAAAFKDERFTPVAKDEVEALDIEISILGDMLPVASKDEIQIGRDGLMLHYRWASGLLLPQVAVEWKWDVNEYLKQICRKTGVPDGSWSAEGAVLYRFEAQVFGS
jgi:AmmeMemoRadiSam system protein A